MTEKRGGESILFENSDIGFCTEETYPESDETEVRDYCHKLENPKGCDEEERSTGKRCGCHFEKSSSTGSKTFPTQY